MKYFASLQLTGGFKKLMLALLVMFVDFAATKLRRHAVMLLMGKVTVRLHIFEFAEVARVRHSSHGMAKLILPARQEKPFPTCHPTWQASTKRLG